MRSTEQLKYEIRKALADYISSEGCSCCQDKSKHEKAAGVLAILLDVEPYLDGSGFDFYKYKTDKTLVQ